MSKIYYTIANSRVHQTTVFIGKAFTDEINAQIQACEAQEDFDSCAYDIYVKSIDLPHIESCIYVVSDCIVDDEYGTEESCIIKGIYENIEHAKRSSVWRDAIQGTPTQLINTTYENTGISIDWIDTDDNTHHTMIEFIDVNKEPFFSEKLCKHSNLVTSGYIIGKKVEHSMTGFATKTGTVKLAEFDHRVAHFLGYFVVETDSGYVIFSYDGLRIYFVKALPADAKFNHILQAITDDVTDFGISIVEIE